MHTQVPDHSARITSPHFACPEAAAQARLLRRLTTVVLVLLVMLLIEASPHTRASVEAPVGGPLLRMNNGDKATVDAVHLATMLDLSISGMLAKGTLEQRFRNDTGEWREAEYLLPLPHDAAVTRLELQLGERRILGEIRERSKARQVFKAARKAGKRAALLEQQRPHLFTTRVANVPPGQEIAVRVELVLPVAYLDGEFSLRFPTTLTAPYFPGLPETIAGDIGSGDLLSLDGSGWAPPTQQVPDAPLLSAPQFAHASDDASPRNPLRLRVRLRPGIPLARVDALYHDLQIERVADGFDLSLQGELVEMDRDVVLRWTPTAGGTPQAAVFRERFDDEEFALLMLVPPATVQSATRLPRELLLVLDVSGSMQGEPIRQARASVLHSLGKLAPEDYVNIIAFNDQHRALFQESRPATQDNLRQIEDFVRRLEAGGGTEMLPALQRALTSSAPSVDDDSVPRLRQLVFVTDGAIGNEDALFALLEQEGRSARVFTVGIGSAPNSYFMHRAAEAGRGAAVFIARASEVAPKLNALFERIGQPLARDIEVHWPVDAEPYPKTVPDLYAGEPLLQAVRLSAPESGQTLRIAGQLAGRAWERQLALPDESSEAGVAMHWARQKIASTLRDTRRGVPREEVRAIALPLALKFSIASPFTSFVAVEEQPLRPVGAPLKAAKVPNAQPQGQAPQQSVQVGGQPVQQIAFAQGATSGPVKLYLGLFLAFMALIGHALNRPEP